MNEEEHKNNNKRMEEHELIQPVSHTLNLPGAQYNPLAIFPISEVRHKYQVASLYKLVFVLDRWNQSEPNYNTSNN